MEDENTLLKEIGERVIEIRKKLKLKQKELAKKLGISPPSLSEIETGGAKPRFELLFALTKIYRVNVYYIFHGEGEMFLPDSPVLSEGGAGSQTGESDEQMFFRFAKESPMVRYHLMAEFRRYLLENRDEIEKDIADSMKHKR